VPTVSHLHRPDQRAFLQVSLQRNWSQLRQTYFHLHAQLHQSSHFSHPFTSFLLALNTNYELRFYDPILPASSGLSVPFKVKSGEITIAMWVKFATAGSRGTFLTLYHSQ